MTVSEIAQTNLRLAARRAYEIGRLHGALRRGAFAGLFALPGFLICNQSSLAGVCLAGFALVVAAGRMRGEAYEEGTQSGAIAGIAPCLIPVVLRTFNPELCSAMVAGIPWPCAVGGVVAGAILGLRGHRASGVPFWIPALTALALAASLGCLPAGLMGFAALLAGLLAGAAPAFALRRAHG
jgi:hypothetical protein